MRSAQPITRAMRRRGTLSTLPHLRRLRTHGQLCAVCGSACGAAADLSCFGVRQPARCLSQQAGRWLDKLRYGAEDAPTLGSWENAYEDNAMDTRKLYCKALVHASGGSRLARDWIAGCAALTSPDPSLIYTALQHTATEADVKELREHFLRRLIARDDTPVEHPHPRHGGEREVAGTRGCVFSGDDNSSGGTASLEVAEEEDEVEREVLRNDEEMDGMGQLNSPATTSTAAGKVEAQQQGDAAVEAKSNNDEDGEESPLSAESVRDAEFLLLSRSPEVRCFMYDAMTASLFHSNYDLRTVEVARRHTFWIGANMFGIAFDELTLLWRVVEAELLLKKEKIKVLGQPCSE